MTLIDLPLKRLRRMLRATERAFGPDSPSADALRRAVAAKQALAAIRRHVQQGAADG
jgi:hypothetical protein